MFDCISHQGAKEVTPKGRGFGRSWPLWLLENEPMSVPEQQPPWCAAAGAPQVGHSAAASASPVQTLQLALPSPRRHCVLL